MTANVSIGIS